MSPTLLILFVDLLPMAIKGFMLINNSSENYKDKAERKQYAYHLVVMGRAA
jgi:hypothetical protein